MGKVPHCSLATAGQCKHHWTRTSCGTVRQANMGHSAKALEKLTMPAPSLGFMPQWILRQELLLLMVNHPLRECNVISDHIWWYCTISTESSVDLARYILFWVALSSELCSYALHARQFSSAMHYVRAASARQGYHNCIYKNKQTTKMLVSSNIQYLWVEKKNLNFK